MICSMCHAKCTCVINIDNVAGAMEVICYVPADGGPSLSPLSAVPISKTPGGRGLHEGSLKYKVRYIC